MNYAQTLFNQIFIMFILLFIGFLLYKIKMISDQTNKQLTKVVLYVVSPAVIISTYQMPYDPTQAKNMLLGFLLSAIALGIAILVSFLAYFKRQKASFPVELFAITFSNCGFIGIPLLFALFGKLGVFYCNTFITVFNILLWTYGILLMTVGEKKEKGQNYLKNLLTPTMFSIVIGLTLYFARIALPNAILEATDYIASMNTPLAMIVSGVYIAQSNILGAFKKKRIYYIVFLKCIVAPLAVILAFSFFAFDETLKICIILLIACPTGANTMLFASSYQKDVERASNVFTLTTLVSIITLPLVIYIAQNI